MKIQSSQNSLFSSEYKDTKNAISILKQMYLADLKKRYPALPLYAFGTPSFKDRTANGLTKCIITFIRLSGFQIERINCQGRIIDNRINTTDITGRSRVIGNVQYGKTTGQRGTADLSATIKGRSVKIEIKIGRDRQSEAQKQYQREIEQSGGIYIIASDFNQFYNWYLQKFGR